MNSPANLLTRNLRFCPRRHNARIAASSRRRPWKTAAAQKVTRKLLTAGLVREIKGKAGTEAWRRDEETGQAYSLLTDAGPKPCHLSSSSPESTRLEARAIGAGKPAEAPLVDIAGAPRRIPIDAGALRPQSPGEVTTGRVRACAASSSQSRRQGSTCLTRADPTSAPARAATARAGNQDHRRS
jgi:hypothetical protein